MNEAEQFSALAVESRLLPEIVEVLKAAGRSDLARVLLPASGIPTSPYQAAVLKLAKRQVEKTESVGFPDECVVVPGEFQGERLVLAWVLVNLAKLSESLISHANGIEFGAGTGLWEARRVRGQFMLLHYPFTQDVLGNSDWTEDHHNQSLEVTVWGKDPDRLSRQMKARFTVHFQSDSSLVKSAQLV